LSASAVRIEEIRCEIEAARKRRADCVSVERACCSVVDVVYKLVRYCRPGSAGRTEASPSGGDESADVVDRAGSLVSRGAEVSPSGGDETADAAVRVGSRESVERSFSGAWVRQP